MVVTTYAYVTAVLRTAWTHNDIFQLTLKQHINMTQIKHINSLCSGSNSLRVHKQLILGCPNSSELNSSEHNKS